MDDARMEKLMAIVERLAAREAPPVNVNINLGDLIARKKRVTDQNEAKMQVPETNALDIGTRAPHPYVS